ncbi:hypothetical protein F511_36177 [Dorcoceras hygrometricum]|uniref:Uncharacterized protein n=1 Tax=Dorcoceras hygrometricum TaxID=472368 RepID=A0A2Z7D014_9LAMI|nr:hypothetical protein F511_36177 [Dorcoceras hygrometricum]
MLYVGIEVADWAHIVCRFLELCLSSLAPLLVEPSVVIRCLMHSILYQPGKSSVRDHQAVSHHSSVVFRHNQSVGHNSDDSVVPFRHDTSVCRSQRQVLNRSKAQYNSHSTDFMPQIQARYVKPLTKAQLVPSILKFYLNRPHQGTATSACSNLLPCWSRPTQQGLPWSSNPEAHTYRRKLYSTAARTHKLTASSRFLSNVDSSHLTGINQKSYSRRAQRHQSRSKQRRKSTAIYRRSVRMNSIYRGFTGENNKEMSGSKYAKF